MDNLDDEIQYLYFISSVVYNLLYCNKSEIIVRELLKLDALKHATSADDQWAEQFHGPISLMAAKPLKTVMSLYYTSCVIYLWYIKLNFTTEQTPYCLHRLAICGSIDSFFFLLLLSVHSRIPHKWHFSLFFNYVEDHREYSLQKGKFKLLVWVNIHD